MARTTKLRVKGNDGLFTEEYNIGAKSPYVSMLSGLNLEEEFKLGDNCITTFNTSDENTTVIIEEYKTEDQTTDYYKLYTSFNSENDDFSITQDLYYVDNNENVEQIKTKTVVFSNESEQLIIKEVVN